jgi:hypothetical protein
LNSATILARASGRDDCTKTIAALTAALERRDDLAIDLERRLDDALEELEAERADREYWCIRALLAERAGRPASFWAALWAMTALGWVAAWNWFETPESRAGIETTCGSSSTAGEAT